MQVDFSIKIHFAVSAAIDATDTFFISISIHTFLSMK